MANRETLVKAVELEIGDADLAYRAVRAIEAAIAATLANGENLRLQTLGTLRPERLPPRRARNPKTGERVIAPATGRVKMTASKSLSEAIRDNLADQN